MRITQNIPKVCLTRPPTVIYIQWSRSILVPLSCPKYLQLFSSVKTSSSLFSLNLFHIADRQSCENIIILQQEHRLKTDTLKVLQNPTRWTSVINNVCICDCKHAQ